MVADSSNLQADLATLLTRPFLLLPRLLATEEAGAFLAEGMQGPKRRTWTGRLVPCPPQHTWEEISIAEGTTIAQWALSGSVLGRVARALGRSDDSPAAAVACWMNRYRAHECIDPHRDGSGSAQLVIGLSARTASGGGDLLLATGDQSARVSLGVGDAVLFDATRLKHWTTPVGRGETRITLVVRYYFAAG